MTSRDAATAAGFGGAPPQRMRLIGFRVVRKNSLRGFASIELPIGLKIDDVPVHVAAGGGAWAALPAKPQIDAEGRHKRDINGKLAYTAMLQWRSRALADQFSERVIALVCEQYPEALGVTP